MADTKRALCLFPEFMLFVLQMISQPQEQTSIIITTNKGFEERQSS